VATASLPDRGQSGLPGVVRVGLEAGAKWVLASALDWPGWSRRGRGEPAALDALLDYASPCLPRPCPACCGRRNTLAAGVIRQREASGLSWHDHVFALTGGSHGALCRRAAIACRRVYPGVPRLALCQA
jgi:hypothetical protein